MTATTLPQIGTMTVPANDRYFYNDSEVACWGRTLSWTDQDVPAYLSADGRDIYWTINAACHNEHYPALLGGVPVGSRPDPTFDPPKPWTMTRRTYAYTVADLVNSGALTLDDGWEIETTVLHHPDYCSGDERVVDPDSTFGGRYVPCSHDAHYKNVGCMEHADQGGPPIVLTERNDRGMLESGYTDTYRRVEHHKLVQKVSA